MIWNLIGKFLMWRIRRRKLGLYELEVLDRLLKQHQIQKKRTTI